MCDSPYLALQMALLPRKTAQSFQEPWAERIICCGVSMLECLTEGGTHSEHSVTTQQTKACWQGGTHLLGQCLGAWGSRIQSLRPDWVASWDAILEKSNRGWQTGDKESNIASRIQQRSSHKESPEESSSRQPCGRDRHLGATPLLRRDRAKSYRRTKSTGQKKKTHSCEW